MPKRPYLAIQRYMVNLVVRRQLFKSPYGYLRLDGAKVWHPCSDPDAVVMEQIVQESALHIINLQNDAYVVFPGSLHKLLQVRRNLFSLEAMRVCPGVGQRIFFADIGRSNILRGINLLEEAVQNLVSGYELIVSGG